jgi:hypothetical protein
MVVNHRCDDRQLYPAEIPCGPLANFFYPAAARPRPLRSGKVGFRTRPDPTKVRVPDDLLPFAVPNKTPQQNLYDRLRIFVARQSSRRTLLYLRSSRQAQLSPTAAARDVPSRESRKHVPEFSESVPAG